MGKITQTLLLLFIASAAAGTGAWLHSRSLSGSAGSGTSPPGGGKLELLRRTDFPDLQGAKHKLADWQGKILVVNFWAAWCDPCRDEIPGFIRLQKAFEGRGVQFVGIAVEPPDRRKEVVAFAREMGVNYPNLMGDYEAMALAQEAGNPTGALPFTLVMDKQGRLITAHLGRLSEDKLRSMLNNAL
jgi:thiol-disulfide isomerase/thioredoxin